jgi:hypothetical protein
MNQTFNELRDQITGALPTVLQGVLHNENGFTLVEGFVSLPIQQNLNTYNIGGQSVPMIALVGKTTGRMYFFALRQLLPNI